MTDGAMTDEHTQKEASTFMQVFSTILPFLFDETIETDCASIKPRHVTRLTDSRPAPHIPPLVPEEGALVDLVS